MSSNSGTNVRTAAILALHKIMRKYWNSAFAIDNFAKQYSIHSRDRALLSEIVYGVLKNITYLDYILLKLLRSGKFPSEKHAMALRIGAFQIALTNVPEYAAVNSTIEALKSLDAHAKEVSLANAVLRNFAKRWRNVKLPEELLKRLAVKYSHPEWLVRKWLERYDAETAEKMLAANNAAPPKYFRINAHKTSPETFIERLESDGYNIRRTVFDEYFELLDKISAADFAPFQNGLVSVQDTAFAIPVKILSPRDDEKILEIGAAPGGKTTYIAEILRGDVRNIFAIDSVHSRNKLVVQNFSRLGMAMPNIITADAAAKTPFLEKIFDKILIDAPCTSWGVVRRHPEIKWHRKRGDSKKFARMQHKMLIEASRLLKPGGLLVFATCTTEPEENQSAMQTMLVLGMKIQKIDKIPQRFLEEDDKIARTVPYRDNFDGSFTIAAKK